jgi:hypothetical protein
LGGPGASRLAIAAAPATSAWLWQRRREKHHVPDCRFL